MTGTDAATYTRDRPGMSAFVLEDGVVYHTYSTYARGLDGLWGMYQWLDRAPKGRNERRAASGGAATTSTTSAERSRGCRGATGGREISRRMVSERASQRAFFGVSALLFAASAAVTIVWCASMSAMGEMPMPGGWTMAMAWMLMPGQTWPGAAASFLGMWVVMMVAMMLPSLAPMLWRYRQAVGRTGETRQGRLTALVGVGYFFVWTVLGGGKDSSLCRIQHKPESLPPSFSASLNVVGISFHFAMTADFNLKIFFSPFDLVGYRVGS